MTNQNLSPSWAESPWIEESQRWIRASLAKIDQPLTGEIEPVRVMPWSAVFRILTTRGIVYFKGSAPVLSNEPALTQAFYHWRPDCIVQVLAVDLEHSWMLMADEGVMLRSLVSGVDVLSHWEILLPRFAGVQIEMIERQKELRSLGLIDRRLHLLPGLFEQLLADRAAMRIGREDGLSEAQYTRLLDFRPRYAEMCRQLETAPIPQSLHHEDLHDGNIYVRGERYTFSDWGESCLAHPFFSLIVNLRSIADRLNLPDEAAESPDMLPPELNRLRDLYLERWTDYAPLPELREIFSLAWRVGMINRAFTWYQVIRQSNNAEQEKYGYAVPAWLGEFLLTV